jgi:3-oxoacyl-[acyl-carrier protein] reductase
MDAGLRGKRALITGGSSGIGRAIALALAREGVDIAIADLNHDAETLRAAEAEGARAMGMVVDVHVEREAVDMVRRAIELLGAIDLLVSNAAATWHQPITRITSQRWFDTLNTNLSACMWACRGVCRHMIERGGGSILIVGSTAQYNQAYGEAAYHVSKAGLRALKNTLALEMAPYGIRVNQLVPGHYPTKLTAGLAASKAERLRHEIPLRRFGRPAECGPAAVFLLSDALSSYVTGAELVVDGGLQLRPLPLFSDEEITLMNRGEMG